MNKQLIFLSVLGAINLYYAHPVNLVSAGFTFGVVYSLWMQTLSEERSIPLEGKKTINWEHLEKKVHDRFVRFCQSPSAKMEKRCR